MKELEATARGIGVIGTVLQSHIVYSIARNIETMYGFRTSVVIPYVEKSLQGDQNAPITPLFLRRIEDEVAQQLLAEEQNGIPTQE